MKIRVILSFMMKNLVFYICSFALVSFTVDSRKIGTILENYDTCLTENNVSNDDMFSVHDVIHDRHKQSENQERKHKNGCVIQCLLQKAGVMEGSEYKVEEYFNKLSKKLNMELESDVHKALENCINETKDLTEKCEKGFAVAECFLKAQEKLHPSEHEHEHESEK